MDERQKQVRGEIFMHACIGMIVLMVLLAILYDFNILHVTLSVSDVLINLVLLTMAYISSALILRDAYFSVINGDQMNVCLWIFTVLALVSDGLTIFDLINGEGISAVTICSLIMCNSIMLSLWYKRKSW